MDVWSISCAHTPVAIFFGSGPMGASKASESEWAGSVLITSTFFPCRASFGAVAAATLVLPTPPLPVYRIVRKLTERRRVGHEGRRHAQRQERDEPEVDEPHKQAVPRLDGVVGLTLGRLARTPPPPQFHPAQDGYKDEDRVRVDEEQAHDAKHPNEPEHRRERPDCPPAVERQHRQPGGAAAEEPDVGEPEEERLLRDLVDAPGAQS